jgi:hypothetical protein
LRRFALIAGLALAAWLLVRLSAPAAAEVTLVQQATDTIRRTPTRPRPPTMTPTSAPAADLGWRGQIASNTPNATSGNGSIVRVRVSEQAQETITLTRYDTTLTGLSGTKPEFGPDVAEFAPVPAGRWTVSVPRLGASIEIDADGYNLVVVEFLPNTATEATIAAGEPPTPTPLSGQLWEGRVLTSTGGPLLSGAILRVTVQGQTGLAIRVAAPDGSFATDNATGAKEELGPYTAEFAPLTHGRYVITPSGLNSSLAVDLNEYSTVDVEFRPVAPLPSPTASAQPPPGTNPPSDTPTPRPPRPTRTPTSTPTPQMQWVGAVVRHDRSPQGIVFGTIAVRVNGLRDLPVTLTSGPTTLTCNTGTKAEYGDYACEFGGLSPGTYTVGAQGLEPVIPIMIGKGDFALVEFRQETVPPEPLAWLGRVVRNSSQPWPGKSLFSAIAVQVEGRRGQVVALRAKDGWETFCDTGTKPEYGAYACEFGGLWPGVYTLSPVGIPAQVSLYMDGVGFAEVAFESFMATATPAPTPTRVIGAGALPVSTPTPSPSAQSPLGTATLLPTRTATRSAQAATPGATRPRPTPTPTETSTPTPTPTPARGWVGSVVQDDVRPGVAVSSIVVRVLGRGGQPVILRSGAWSTRGLSGTKPEYGENAVEFGGVGAGDFSVELEGLGAVLPVHLRQGGFMVIEFRYDVLPTATPTPQHGIWVGAVTSNTSGPQAASGVASIIIVKIPGVNNSPVAITTDGFATSCVTGAKPEYGPGACDVGGLWPGTYRVTPQGLGLSVDVWVDGRGSATVEFWVQ